jgi:hypothetical protein
MIEAALIAAGAGGLGMVGVIVWLVVRYVEKTDALADARVAQSQTESHLEEAQFKLEQVQLALTASEHVVDVQSKELSADDDKPTNTDLAPDDTAGRVRRLFASWAVSDASAAAATAASAAVPAPAAPAASSGVPR